MQLPATELESMNIEERLARLEEQTRIQADREAMWRLMARYAKATDEEDDVDLAAVFAPDATCETVPWSKGKVFEGRESIVKLFKGYQARFKNRKRFITNEIIDVLSPTAGNGWSNWLVLHANDGHSFIGWGCYDWGFRREADEWLISSFVVHVECMTTLENGWADAQNLLVSFPRRK